MKLMVTGGRDFRDGRFVSEILDTTHNFDPISLLIVGDASGVDTLAATWAQWNNIPTKIHVANWKKYGRAAGPIRNRKMVERQPDLVIAFPGGAGTANAMKTARQAGITVIEVPAQSENEEIEKWLIGG